MADPIVQAAVRFGMLKSGQVEEAEQLRVRTAESGLNLTLAEICLKKEWLTADQLRLLTVYRTYEDARAEDEEFARFLVQRGFVVEPRVHECLESQKASYEKGTRFSRLEDLLIRKGALTAHQLEGIQRARTQFDEHGNHVAPARRPEETPVPPAERTKSETRTLHSSAGKKAPSEGAMLVDGCKVGLRRLKVKDAQGRENEVGIVDMEGVLDGHTFKHFDEYLNGLLDGGLAQIILNLQKVDYVSSAGIGVLAGAVKRCRDSKGDLRLCSVQDKVRKIITLVGLQSMLRLYDHERGALLSFKYL